MSIVPDKVIFGIDSLNKPIDYGFVRQINDDNELINLLRLRLRAFFVDQVQVLQKSRSAFPLATMTCVGIETLGEIFVKENKDDTSFQFVETLKKVHQTFGRKPNKKFEKKLQTIWAEKDFKNVDNFAKIVYRFFRNTMIHGYQAKGMFLSYEDTDNIEIDEEFAFLKVNPDWFWNNFKTYYENQFTLVQDAEENNSARQNCLKYIKTFLLL